MRLPSVKTIERAFPGKGKVMRRLLESSEAVKSHPAAQELERRCYNPPGLAYMRMTALNAEAGTFGIEAVWKAGTGPGDCTSRPAFEYLNTGDTYTSTLIRFRGGRYTIRDWGTIVERGNYS